VVKTSIYRSLAKPGPPKHPCGYCYKPVAKNHRAVLCKACNYWSHIKCAKVSPTGWQIRKFFVCFFLASISSVKMLIFEPSEDNDRELISAFCNELSKNESYQLFRMLFYRVFVLLLSANFYQQYEQIRNPNLFIVSTHNYSRDFTLNKLSVRHVSSSSTVISSSLVIQNFHIFLENLRWF
jgi:hypothetical protein